LVPLMIVSALSFFTKYSFEKQPIHFPRGEPLPTGHSNELATLESIELLHLADHDYHTLTPENTLREILNVLSTSKRNFFPVLDPENNLLGVITLDDLRQVMFDANQMDQLKVKDLMHMPPAHLDCNERIFSALDKFDSTNYWNLPVLRDGKFAGFISKSTLLDKLRKEVDKNQDIF
jgi:CIC family chloride channel protein